MFIYDLNKGAMVFWTILLIVIFFTAVILPWINSSRISDLRNEVDSLNNQLGQQTTKAYKTSAHQSNKVDHAKLDNLARSSSTANSSAKADSLSMADQQITYKKSKAISSSSPMISSKVDSKESSGNDTVELSKKHSVDTPLDQPSEAPLEHSQEDVIQDKHVAPQSNQEPSKDWFGKLAVWVGGIALLMAGFYMVKHSIHSGWVTPKVRVLTTASFGALLTLVGFLISVKSHVHGVNRVVQALIGAGVACLYFAVYAGVNLYGLISPGFGFTGMVAVTLVAVALSLRHGVPIALMGFIGGFLTPMLTGDFHDDSVSLFVYLFLLLAASQFLCAKRGWWWLFFTTLSASYIWSGAMLFGFIDAARVYPEGLLLFILGICGLNAGLMLFFKPQTSHLRHISAIRLLTWAGGLLQAFVALRSTGFGNPDLAVFSLLCFGALVLAVIREKDFLPVAAGALGTVLLTVVSYDSGYPLWKYYLWPAAIAGVFFIVGHFKSLRSDEPRYWRALSLAAIALTPIISYINSSLISHSSIPFTTSWLLLSLGIAVVILIAAEHLKRHLEPNSHVLSIYSSVAFLLIGLGLWEYLPEKSLSLGISGLLLIAGLYWKIRKLARPDIVLTSFSIAWLVSMLWKLAYALFYLLNIPFYHGPQLNFETLASWYIGVAVLAIIFYWFGQVLDTSKRSLARWVLGLSLLLLLVTTYQYLDEVMFSHWWAQQTITGGLTSLLAFLALLSLRNAPTWRGGIYASHLMLGFAIFRVLTLHLFGKGAEGESFFFNALFWQFGVPFMSLSAMAWISRTRETMKNTKFYQIVAMFLGFIWVSFLVQDFSGSSSLLSSVETNTELYSYSLAWLLLALVYQTIGLWREVKTLHIGSLVLLLLTVGKVFFVDASELEGLYRVLSFLGLGITLIGIGFFYNKVVFGRRKNGEDI